MGETEGRPGIPIVADLRPLPADARVMAPRGDGWTSTRQAPQDDLEQTRRAHAADPAAGWRLPWRRGRRRHGLRRLAGRGFSVRFLGADGRVSFGRGSATANEHARKQPEGTIDPFVKVLAFAAALGRTIQAGRAERGVLICGSGVGASVAANKLKGIRAGLCHDTYSAHQGVEHDDMNVIVLGSRIIGPALARELVRTYLGASFSHEERHERRVAKIRALEDNPEC